MKRFLSILLAVAMIATMSVSAFAAVELTDLDNNGKATNDVKAKWVDTNATYVDTIGVTIAWDAMNFTYTTAADTMTWDPANLKWNETATGSGTWDNTTANVVVTNYSNVKVDATASYTAEVASVTGEFDKTEAQQLNAAAVDTVGGTATFILTIGGKYEVEGAEFAKVGTATITIAKAVEKE